MKQKIYFLLLLTAVISLLAGCAAGKEKEGDGPFLYYVNTDGTGLVKQEAGDLDQETEQAVESMLEELQAATDSVDYKSAFPQGVAVEKCVLDEGRLALYFTEDYQEMDRVSEVLLRAAVVQSLTQIEGVDSVEFYIGDTPLVGRDGNAVGAMTSEDFVQNVGSSLHSYQVGDFSLYFANSNGDKLVRKEVRMRYNSNNSAEKMIVEQLIKGPSDEELLPTLPEETRLLGISVRDGVCYVNFSEEFLTAVENVDPELTIYSIVNSIAGSGNAGQVQILVNGETNISYQGANDISQPFSMNADLIEEDN
ncbi:GerMN domain-containing protein [Lachnospiraceae bacterium KGMB03038]|nr:GerMN domain-containing protein [Lachnospiraceae bacterium KGMB03038]